MKSSILFCDEIINECYNSVLCVVGLKCNAGLLCIMGWIEMAAWTKRTAQFMACL